MSGRTEKQVARDLVLDALTTIQMLDADPDFRAAARLRYLTIMAAASITAPLYRPDGGADIVMKHTAIAGQ